MYKLDSLHWSYAYAYICVYIDQAVALVCKLAL